MEGSIITDPVPAVEEPEITFAAATDGSGGGDGSAASFPWSLTHDQQVQNLKTNWIRIFDFPLFTPRFLDMRDIDSETSPWFATVVTKLRDDPCLDSYDELEIDNPKLTDGLVSGFRMTTLDVAILMGDLKMVQKILETSSDAENLVRGSLILDRNKISIYFLDRISPKSTCYFYTPLHLAVGCENYDIVIALLEKGADVNVLGWDLETPLDLAYRLKNVDMLLRLLEDDREEKGPLHVAVKYGDVEFMKKLPTQDVNPLGFYRRTLLHSVATYAYSNYDSLKDVVKYLVQDKAYDLKALDSGGLSAFYVAILCCHKLLVQVLLDSFKDHIRLNEACDKDLGPPVQIAFEGGNRFKDIESALMECDPVKGYMERLYRDRQVYVDAANAILVGAALIASVTFASWLQPPLNYTSYIGDGYSSSVPTPSTSDLNYADVEHNIPLRAFWVFNAFSFYFAIATVVCGARSVLPRSHLFIAKTVEKLRINLLVTSVLLALSVLFVIIAFAIAGAIVLTPLLKYQLYMIVPTIVGGIVCIVSLFYLVKSMVENSSNTSENIEKRNGYLEDRGYRI